jgi:hypothetical protein
MSISTIIALLISVGSAVASASETPNRYGVIADWDNLLGTYQGRTPSNDQDCEVEILATTDWLSRPLLLISITQSEGEQMSFEAPLATYKKSLAQGNHSAGTAAYAEKLKGFTLGRHTTTYGMLNFTEPATANEFWPLRGVDLSWTEAEFYLVTNRQHMSCWNLQK